MTAFIIRAAVSGLIIALVSLVARRSPAVGALIASLPLISLLAMTWLWLDKRDTTLLAAQSEATFWYVLPSLPMFLLIPWMLRTGIAFWPALAAGCVLTILLSLVTIVIAARFGVRL